MTFSLSVEQRDRYRFDVVFDDPSWKPIPTDEPAPLGGGTAPNPSRLLGAAIGNCMAASLLFCLEKARVPTGDIRARVTGSIGRNDRGRLRIQSVKVLLEPTVDGVPPQRMARCLEVFEDFCIVTQSVREGMDVDVAVEPRGLVSGGTSDQTEPVGT
jgi:organic hydroperoxide reductase OsmC/OhrA